MPDRMDKAFDWFVLVLSIISGTLSSFPEVIPFLKGENMIQLSSYGSWFFQF